jgi:hypothetical protein
LSRGGRTTGASGQNRVAFGVVGIAPGGDFVGGATASGAAAQVEIEMAARDAGGFGRWWRHRRLSAGLTGV